MHWQRTKYYSMWGFTWSTSITRNTNKWFFLMLYTKYLVS